jgi:predicted Zn-dependent peptidase
VLLVERHDVPTVVLRGAGDMPEAKPGAAGFVANMLESGTSTRRANEIGAAYDALGANHSAWMEWDATMAHVRAAELQDWRASRRS